MTASTFAVSALGVVLHRHRRLGLWLQPGGHVEAARRRSTPRSASSPRRPASTRGTSTRRGSSTSRARHAAGAPPLRLPLARRGARRRRSRPASGESTEVRLVRAGRGTGAVRAGPRRAGLTPRARGSPGASRSPPWHRGQRERRAAGPRRPRRRPSCGRATASSTRRAAPPTTPRSPSSGRCGRPSASSTSTRAPLAASAEALEREAAVGARARRGHGARDSTRRPVRVGTSRRWSTSATRSPRARAELDDELLALLEQLEPLDASDAALRHDATRVTRPARRARRRGRRRARPCDRRRLAELTAQRPALAAALDAALLARYEAIAARAGGVGAARLVDGRCGACRVTRARRDRRPPGARRRTPTRSRSATSAAGCSCADAGARSPRPHRRGTASDGSSGAATSSSTTSGATRHARWRRASATWPSCGRARCDVRARPPRSSTRDATPSSTRRSSSSTTATCEGLALDEVEPAHCGARCERTQPRRWPGGESLEDVQGRVAAACAALFESDGEGARATTATWSS